MYKIKHGTIVQIYSHINNFNRAIDHLRSQFQAKEVLPIGKEISLKDMEPGDRKKVIGYEKNSKTEFRFIVNIYQILKNH